MVIVIGDSTLNDRRYFRMASDTTHLTGEIVTARAFYRLVSRTLAHSLTFLSIMD